MLAEGLSENKRNSMLFYEDTCVKPDKFANATFIIFGASGLIGSHCIFALEELNKSLRLNISIVACARHTERLHNLFHSSTNVIIKSVDITSESTVSKVIRNVKATKCFIVDVASPANPALYSSQPVQTMLSNIDGLRNIISTIVSMKKQKKTSSFTLLYTSSSEIYGKTYGWHLMTEDEQGYIDILDPRSCYPIAKQASETLLTSARKQYGLDVRIIRPSHVFGPGFLPSDNRVSADFFVRAINKEPIILRSTGLDRRTPIYITDCVSGLLTVLAAGEPGEAYNVSNSQNLTTLRSFSQQIAEQAHVEFQAAPLPDHGQGDQEILQRATALSDKKLRSLGWKPQVGLAEGISRTFQILRQG